MPKNMTTRTYAGQPAKKPGRGRGMAEDDRNRGTVSDEHGSGTAPDVQNQGTDADGQDRGNGMDDLIQIVTALYRKTSNGRHPSLQSIVDSLNSRGYDFNYMKVRKLLMAAGVYEPGKRTKVLPDGENTISGTADIIGSMSLSSGVSPFIDSDMTPPVNSNMFPSVNSGISLSTDSGMSSEEVSYVSDKTVSGEKSTDRDYQRVCHERKVISDQIRKQIEEGDVPEALLVWKAIVLFAGYPFETMKGLKFTYIVKGGEVFITRKEKSITRSSVEMAYRKTLELGGKVSGPKKLGVFGASYLYPVFKKIGVIGEP